MNALLFKAHLPQLLGMFVYVAMNPSVNITISKLPLCQEHKGPPLKIYLWDETRPVPRCLGGWCQNFPGFDSFSKIEPHDWKVLERWHIPLTWGRTRPKPSTKNVGLSFVGVSLSFMRPENSLNEGLGPGPAEHQRWARLTSRLQGAYSHFLKTSLTLSDVTKQAWGSTTGVGILCVNQLACDGPEHSVH